MVAKSSGIISKLSLILPRYTYINDNNSPTQIKDIFGRLPLLNHINVQHEVGGLVVLVYPAYYSARIKAQSHGDKMLLFGMTDH